MQGRGRRRRLSTRRDTIDRDGSDGQQRVQLANTTTFPKQVSRPGGPAWLFTTVRSRCLRAFLFFVRSDTPLPQDECRGPLWSALDWCTSVPGTGLSLPGLGGADYGMKRNKLISRPRYPDGQSKYLPRSLPRFPESHEGLTRGCAGSESAAGRVPGGARPWPPIRRVLCMTSATRIAGDPLRHLFL